MSCFDAPPQRCRRKRKASPVPAARIRRQIEAAVALTLVGPEPAGPKTSAAPRVRQTVMYLMRVVFGLRYGVIGRLYGRDHTTVIHACRVIEERRDDPDANRVLQALENLSRSIADEATARVTP